LPKIASEREHDVRAAAHILLRKWLAASEGEILSMVDALGRREIGAAADASGRLARETSSTLSAERSLGNLQALAEGLETPTRRRGLSFLGGWREGRPDDTQANINALVEKLDEERDAVALSLIAIETDRKRFLDAADRLDEALGLIRACAHALDAVAREISIDLPDRARFLRDTVAGRLLSREQDVVLQAAVTQQGVLTLQVLADGQDALAQALGRARETTVAALRTAIAARKAVAGSRVMARQAAALEQVADAARDRPADRDAVRRVLDDAIVQARRAIAAGERSTCDGDPPGARRPGDST
jgi:ribosomal 50S subunit-associated protein YjgA (DUF615 family)